MQTLHLSITIDLLKKQYKLAFYRLFVFLVNNNLSKISKDKPMHFVNLYKSSIMKYK